MRTALLLLLAITVSSAQWMQLDCSELADGVYGEECSSSVTLCLHGESLDSVCPPESLFNSRAARCLPYSSEAACQQGELTQPRDARPCVDIGNWRRGEGACSPQYNLCLNGETHTLLCPAQSFYDESESTCSSDPSDCQRDDEWRAGSGEDDVQTICAKAGSEGFFGIGCSSSFAACAAGNAVVMSCPAELKFDETRQKCEYPGNVVACGGVAPEEGSGVEGSGVEGSGHEGSGEVDGSGAEGSGEEAEDITHACVDRVDGFYRLGACSEHFVGCSGGVAWMMNCPASLKYDEQKQICDYPGNVDGCEEKDEESSGEEEVEGSGEGSGEEIVEIVEGSGEIEASGEVIFEGSGIEGTEGSGTEGSGTEGSGSEGSGTEGSGSEGSGTEGSGDIESDAVIEEEKIVETEDIIVVKDRRVAEVDEHVEEIEAEDEIIDDNGVSVEKEEVKETEIENDVIDENGVETGEEAMKPTETGDEAIDDVEENGEEVAEVVDAAPVTGSSQHLQQKQQQQHVQQQPTTAAPARDDDVDVAGSCSGRGDGFYALGCSSEMLACSNGLAHIMPCPAGLVFDERNQMCDYPSHVAACAARDEMLSEDGLMPREEEGRDHPEIPKRRTESIVDATLAPTTPAASIERADRVSNVDGPRRDARCKSSSGLFSLGCSSEFVSCTEGAATLLTCGKEEAFDERSQSCVPLARHPLCFAHAVRPTDVLDDDVQMVKDADEEEDLQKPVDHSFGCSTDGARASSECSDWFTLCEGGRGLEMYCLQGYLFDGETRKCVPAAQLAHCQAQ